VRARARTNELDAGKRWPMIGGEEKPAGLWLRGRGFARWFPGCVRRSGGAGLTATNSAARRWAGAMTMSSGATGLLSQFAGRGP